jgi:hypothetical protein
MTRQMPSQEDFRKNFEDHYAGPGRDFEEFAPLYEYGFRMADDPDFRGRTFRDVEEELKDHYLRHHPHGEWDRVRDAILYGWETGGGAVGGWAFI